jgi:transcriptional regulator with XRE-family HTH domain
MKEIALRIHKLIAFYQLSSASFADQIGVQRSSISHILSGRNKPSLDFVLKTLKAFPTLSSDWLLHGHGEIEAADSIPASSIARKKEIPKETPTITPETTPTEIHSQTSSEIDQVLILRSDGTFQHFKEQKSLNLPKK